MPPGAGMAIVIAAVVGIGLAFAESFCSEKYIRWIPSASAVGLGFVIPAWNALSMFAGSAAAAVFMYVAPELAKRRIVVIAAGLIVGESLAGVVGSLFAITD